MMKILVISSAEWDDSNSFGSSYSNIFGGLKNVEIANIYCRSGIPNTQHCTRFFQITEKMLLKNLLNKRNAPGRAILPDDYPGFPKADTLSPGEQHLFDLLRKKRWMIMFWLRDMIWMFGRWKSQSLNTFVREFNPDLIFLPVSYSAYMNRIALYLKGLNGVPMVGYISDDYFTLRQFSLSPFYWIDRLLNRRWVKKVINQCRHLYVISAIQKKECEQHFGTQCSILFKGGTFAGVVPSKEVVNSPIRLVYTGNLADGRYRTLSSIGKVLDAINRDGQTALLHIYTWTPLTRTMKTAMLRSKSIIFHGGADHSEIPHIQCEADILVHAESFERKGRLVVRQSFSTKIVDYFQAARCIFAVGWENAASIQYLMQNDAAIVATNESEMEQRLGTLLNHTEMILAYGRKGWECGRRNHQIDDIHKALYESLARHVN